MSEYGNLLSERDKVIQQELNLVFNTFNMGDYDRTKDELQGLRYSANDLEKVEQLVTKSVLGDTNLKEDEEEFQSIVETFIYSYYLMLHFTDMYLESGDFMGLTHKTFEYVWGNISLEDKVSVIEMALLLEDTMVIVYGMYLLLTQVERVEKGG